MNAHRSRTLVYLTLIIVATLLLCNCVESRAGIINSGMTSLAEAGTQSLATTGTSLQSGDNQPAHSVKLVHQPGTSGYQAFCCPDPIDQTSVNENKKPSAISQTPEEMLPMNDVTVYPNPASDYLVIKNAHGANLYLFTCMGKQIYFSTINHEDPINISSVPCGCYTLKIEKENRFRSMKLHVRR